MNKNNTWIKLFLTFGYSGLSPVMPGTVGSLIALIPVIFLNFYLSYFWAQTILLLAIVTCFFLGVIGCRYYAIPIFGEDDPSLIVIDEVVGIWIAIWLWSPSDRMGKGEFDIYDWGEIFIAFSLFRFFDISKLGGIKKLEKIPNGWGVMLDDVAAGLLSFLIFRIWEWWY